MLVTVQTFGTASRRFASDVEGSNTWPLKPSEPHTLQPGELSPAIVVADGDAGVAPERVDVQQLAVAVLASPVEPYH